MEGAHILFDTYLVCLLKVLAVPKRYSDLISVCPNESTRTKKLRSLEEAGLVKTAVLKRNHRTFIHYKLTRKGEEALKLLNALEEL